MNSLRFISEEIVWQEVPNETSLAFLISGCPLGCKGCHSADSWKQSNGTKLCPIYLANRIALYKGLISCVLFMGGEWQEQNLLAMLKLVKEQGLKTCLYTGLELDQVSDSLLNELDYIKTGRWIAERGGLNSLTTNQRFIDLNTKQILNHLFQQVSNND
ncbi:anaerobic ribonucleoside-triphosphate reductase activating protein [Pasteurellaceae bacterium LFhippo2]|nr:anaerobic ribonucleoside-triphosphate reductase activating protein [Pasteurellaceae bacterium LFhippo2]